MRDFNKIPDFVSQRSIDSDTRTRSVTDRNLFPEDSLFDVDTDTGEITPRYTMDKSSVGLSKVTNRTVTISATEPSSPVDGDIWFDIS